MWEALEERVQDIDGGKQTEQDKESAVVRIEMGFVRDRFIDAAFTREKEERGKKQNRRRDQNKNEKKKGPRLLVAPAVKNPPRYDQIKKKIHNPEDVHPIEASV